MAKKIGEAFVGIRPETAGFSREASPALHAAGVEGGSTFGSGFKSMFFKVAGSLAAIFAFDKLKDLIVESTQAQREFQRAERLTDAVLKSTGEAAGVSGAQVTKLTDQLGRMAGVTPDTVRQGTNLLLTFRGIHNAAGANNDIFNQANAALLNMTAGLHSGTINSDNLRSTALQLGKALNDPATGMTALRRAGVSFTAAQVDQIKTMEKSGNLMGAQRIILAELTKEFGGAAKAAADPAQRASVAWQILKTQIGALTLPVLNNLATFFSEKIAPVLQDKVIPALQRFGGWLSEHVVPVIRDHLVPAIRDHLVPWLQKMNTWIGDNVVPKLKELWGWIQKNVLPVLKEFGAKVEEFVKNFLPGLNKSLGDNSKQLKDVGRFLTELVGIIVKYVLPIIGGIFLSQLYLVKFAIQGIITVIGAVTRAIEYLWAHRGDILNFLKDLGSKLLEVPKMFFQAGIDVVTGIWDGIKSMGGWLWDQITGFFKDNLVNPIKKLLHLGSPSKLFFGYGQDTVQGFIDGVMGKGDAVASALRRTIGVTPPPGLGAGGQGGTPANIQNIFNLTGPSVAELAAQVSREMAWAQGA